MNECNISLSNCEKCNYSSRGQPHKCSCYPSKKITPLGLTSAPVTQIAANQSCIFPNQDAPGINNQNIYRGHMQPYSRTFDQIQICPVSSFSNPVPLSSRPSHIIEVQGNKTDVDHYKTQTEELVRSNSERCKSGYVAHDKELIDHDTNSWFQKTSNFLASKCKREYTSHEIKETDLERDRYNVFDWKKSETESNKAPDLQKCSLSQITNKNSIYHSSFKRSASRSPIIDSSKRHRTSVSPKFRSFSSKNELKYNPSSQTRRSSPALAKENSQKSTFNEASKQRKSDSKRDNLLAKWREDGRGNLRDKIASLNPEKELEKEKSIWTRTSPGDLFYERDQSNVRVVYGTKNLSALCIKFEEELLKKPQTIRSELPKYEPLPRKKKIPIKHSGCHSCSSSSNSSSANESENEDCIKEELEHKKNHPLRLHQELWFNEPGEMNDGPLCRCSARARRSGIRHNIYAGENSISMCDPNSNNADKLYHYRITISPPTNFLVKTPTLIEYDAHEYIFEGFSLFSHKKLDTLPLCKVIRFNIEYTIYYFEEKFPENFTVRELNIFYDYLFKEILELVDLDLRATAESSGCPQYHFMPRFVRELEGNGKEILSMNEVIRYLLESSSPLVSPEKLSDVLKMSQYEWQSFTESVKGMIVTYPGKKPCSLRVDQLDRDQDNAKEPHFPEIVHFGIRPPQLSYAGNPEYQKAWREYVKFRHLLANMPKPSFEDKRKLESKEIRLQNMRTKSEMKRNVTVTVSSEHFYKTGIMCDIVQHTMLIPVLVSHLRFHRSLDVLEEKIKYTFTNRYLLQLALTHPSYRENFGTNPDHARNSLTNCGIRQPVYGDRRIHYMNTRKRGINTLINIMSRFGKSEETESKITHNERLEFLGDAVVEFVTSIHLFHMFPDLEEGGLATYRAAIVQNQHLALLAKTLGLEAFMLYAHGSDLCHDLELRHAMANCFEALMGALFLDGGIEIADKVFGAALFKDDDGLLNEWVNYPPHPLQEQEPLGDRKWISCFAFLQKLTKFEDSIGIQFNHIRLLARAFTDRSIGFTNLTLGSNQRLEFLGDTVLQLIASEYLYKFFPEHHEGHLSLLRSSLVNNKTQAVVCNDLDMTAYALYSNPKAELKTKDRADLLEAFLGALYIDKGLKYCQTFCGVCFFPRLQDFIMNQDWNDPKSKLQQCCLTLRTMEGGEPEIPVYKVIECMGPTNTRIYTVAVYFKQIRLAKASGHSIQQAEMNAAKKALNNSEGLFPQLNHQKRIISKCMNRQQPGKTSSSKKNKIPSTSDKKKSSSCKKEISAIKAIQGHSRVKGRTPPLAYQSRNKSESPEKLSTKTSECKYDGKRNADKYVDQLLNDENSKFKNISADKDKKNMFEDNLVVKGKDIELSDKTNRNQSSSYPEICKRSNITDKNISESYVERETKTYSNGHSKIVHPEINKKTLTSVKESLIIRKEEISVKGSSKEYSCVKCKNLPLTYEKEYRTVSPEKLPMKNSTCKYKHDVKRAKHDHILKNEDFKIKNSFANEINNKLFQGDFIGKEKNTESSNETLNRSKPRLSSPKIYKKSHSPDKNVSTMQNEDNVTKHDAGEHSSIVSCRSLNYQSQNKPQLLKELLSINNSLAANIDCIISTDKNVHNLIDNKDSVVQNLCLYETNNTSCPVDLVQIKYEKELTKNPYERQKKSPENVYKTRNKSLERNNKTKNVPSENSQSQCMSEKKVNLENPSNLDENLSNPSNYTKQKNNSSDQLRSICNKSNERSRSSSLHRNHNLYKQENTLHRSNSKSKTNSSRSFSRSRSRSSPSQSRSRSRLSRNKSRSPFSKNRSRSRLSRNRSRRSLSRNKSRSPFSKNRSRSRLSRNRSRRSLSRNRSRSPFSKNRSRSRLSRNKSKSPFSKNRSRSPLSRSKSRSSLSRNRSISHLRRRSRSYLRQSRSRSHLRRSRSRSCHSRSSRKRSHSRSHLRRSRSRSCHSRSSRKRSHSRSHLRRSRSRSCHSRSSRKRSHSRSPTKEKFISSVPRDRSRSREEARKRLMDFMLGVQGSSDCANKSATPDDFKKLGASTLQRNNSNLHQYNTSSSYKHFNSIHDYPSTLHASNENYLTTAPTTLPNFSGNINKIQFTQSEFNKRDTHNSAVPRYSHSTSSPCDQAQLRPTPVYHSQHHNWNIK